MLKGDGTSGKHSLRAVPIVLPVAKDCEFAVD